MKNFVFSIGLILLCFLGLVSTRVYGQAQEQNKAQSKLTEKGVILFFSQNLNVNDPNDAKKLEEFSLYLKEEYGKSRQMIYLYQEKSFVTYFSNTKLSELEPTVATISQKFNFVKIKKMGEDEFISKYPNRAKTLIDGQSIIINKPENVHLSNETNSNSNSKPKN